ncbi:hypothetical protein EKG37_06760 [Robertmurraya yapensis]|uniref:Uncharacterized protein n=2 Tax=Bacillus yapensis TaxID=2492960 RepID=A0A431WF79_9BACI|nr:hypothetical protein EKG37_06760 [Bacillus yapensis]TKS97417.1 hypothetical protein FAR12_06760 [Bacillus yapensis]
MSFPLRNHDGWVPMGIFYSVLFLIALVLIVNGLKKYRIRTLFAVTIIYGLLPLSLITFYQETFANGIMAISYDGSGNCTFESVDENVINGECNITLLNHSNEPVSFELQLVDSVYFEDAVKMESMMNTAGPFQITLPPNQEEIIKLKELLDLKDDPSHITNGSVSMIHIQISDGKRTRVL